MIDEASARAGLSVYLPTPELSKLEASKRELEQKKEDAIIAEDFALAGEIKRQQKELQLTIDQMHAQADAKRQKNKLVVTENEVAEVIADWTKIPVQKLQEAETERLKHLEEILHERVVGQEEAVKAVAKAVRRGRVGMKDPNRPIGSFLFWGQPVSVRQSFLRHLQKQYLDRTMRSFALTCQNIWRNTVFLR